MFTSKNFTNWCKEVVIYCRARSLIKMMVFTKVQGLSSIFGARFLMPKHDNGRNSELFANVESRVSTWQKTQSRSAISAHRVNALNILFIYCKKGLSQTEAHLLLWCFSSVLHRKGSSLSRYHHRHTSPVQ